MVVVVIGVYSSVPVTVPVGSAARRRVATLGRVILLRITPPLLVVAGIGAGEGPPVLSDTPPPLDGDAPPDEVPSAAAGKGSVNDAAPGKGTAGVSKSLVVRSRIWLINPCTCGSADTPLAFSRLAGMSAVKSRTPV